ncbi:MAG: uracil-DNA glycosylase family protein [Methylocaldum sp.]|nr:uracil-DNA glycosylase family protein [Methylocaldum sp.]
MNERLRSLILHQEALKHCVRCARMIGPVVMGRAVLSPVILIGQAPGGKEGQFGKPFAWTAGKTLFKWFAEIGISEDNFRRNVYMAAVCRCFPGKNPKGGDRVPSPEEIDRCADWLNAEIRLIRPKLIIPVGKLAIRQILVADRLDQVIGLRHELCRESLEIDVIPLPHPSGASTWHRREPGKTLLHNALRLIREHPAWGEVCHGSSDGVLT